MIVVIQKDLSTKDYFATNWLPNAFQVKKTRKKLVWKVNMEMNLNELQKWELPEIDSYTEKEIDIEAVPLLYKWEITPEYSGSEKNVQIYVTSIELSQQWPLCVVCRLFIWLSHWLFIGSVQAFSCRITVIFSIDDCRRNFGFHSCWIKWLLCDNSRLINDRRFKLNS